MNNKQNDVFTSLKGTDQLLITNAVKLAPIADLVSGAAQHHTYVSTIDDNLQIQNIDVKGVTLAKRGFMNDVIKLTFKHAAALLNLGNSTHDNNMAQQFSFTKATLKGKRSNDLISIAQTTHSAANTHVAALAGAGITAATITAFGTAIASLITNNTAPEQLRNDRKIATQAIRNDLGISRWYAQHILLPLMIANFEDTEPTFLAQFIESLQVVNSPSQTFSLFGAVTDTQTTNPLSDVTLTLMNGNDIVATAKGSKKGNYRFKSITPGMYQLKLQRPAYGDKVVTNVLILSGQSLRLSFTLDANVVLAV